MATSDQAQRRTAVEIELALAEARVSQLKGELLDICLGLNDTTPVLNVLPEDVMIEVFQYLLPWHPDPEILGYGCLVKPIQFTLGAICRTWRSIVWGFPGFWKEVRVTFAEESDAVAEIQLELLREWLQRTSKLPLHISLLLEQRRKLVPILRILLKESRRWRSLQVAGEATHRLRKEMSKWGYSFPMLNSIFLGTDSHEVPSPVDIPWTFDTEFSLRHLTLGEGTRWKNAPISLDWPTIEHFQFVGDEAAGLIFMSKMAESLLSAQLKFLPVADPEGMRTVQLPALRELAIGDAKYPEPIAATCPITFLETPALQRLHLYLDPMYTTSITHLSTMLVRSQSSLVDLSLENLDAPMDALIEILQIVPRLRAFSFNLIGESALTDEFINAMNPLDGHTSIRGRCLPNISKIVYKGRISVQIPQIITLLRSRLVKAPTDKQIEDFTIHYQNAGWGGAADPNVLCNFQHEICALKSLGTTFNIKYLRRGT